MNPKDRHIRQDVPELRIVEQDLWDQAQHRLGLIRQVSGADQRVAVPFWSKRRPHHLLTGKLFCGACGGAMSNVGRNYLACAAARRLEVCQNRLSIRRERLDQLILDALRDRLMQPEHVAAFTAEFIREWNKLQAGTASDRAVRERELQAVDRRLNGLIEAIADGLAPPAFRRSSIHWRRARRTCNVSLLPLRTPHRRFTPTWPDATGPRSRRYARL